MAKRDTVPVQAANKRLLQFLRIERQQTDLLQVANLRHPQSRTVSNARIVQYCRIARGQTA